MKTKCHSAKKATALGETSCFISEAASFLEIPAAEDFFLRPHPSLLPPCPVVGAGVGRAQHPAARVGPRDGAASYAEHKQIRE